MRKFMLYALMVTTALLTLAVVLFFTLGLLMMVAGDCGATMFDFPGWPLQLFITLAIPAVTVFLGVKIWRSCAKRLTFVSLK